MPKILITPATEDDLRNIWAQKIQKIGRMSVQRLLERSMPAILCFSDGNSHNRSTFLFDCMAHRYSYIGQDSSLFYIPLHLPHIEGFWLFSSSNRADMEASFPYYEEFFKASSRRIIEKNYLISTHRIPSGRHAGEITWLPFSSVFIRLAKVTVSSP
jgi:hypothetical protein